MTVSEKSSIGVTRTWQDRCASVSLTRKNRLLIAGASMALLLVLMLVSIDPQVQYSVDDVMDDPSSYEGSLHVRGEVSIGSLDTGNFSFTISG